MTVRALGALLLTTAVLAGPWASPSASAAPRLMPVSAVRRGMRGKGLTVVSGTRPSEFRVEILGVLRNAWPKGDLILAKLRGIRLEKTGVASGMSGSPVYINGRLIGAVAFTWSDLKEPICGISPIHQMLEAMGLKREAPPRVPVEAVEGRAMPAVMRLPRLRGGARPRPGTDLAPKPIATPVFISSFCPELVAELAPAFERCGLRPVQGGAAVTLSETPDLRPGSMIGIQLVGGDLSMVASGTVTYRDGDRFLAFGHPMFNAGACDLPVTGGLVHVVMPRATLSFKLTGATQVIGRLTNDFPFAVAGELGQAAPTARMTVAVRNATRERKETFTYDLALDRQWTGLLTGYVMGISLTRGQGVSRDMTASVFLRLKLRDKPWLALRERVHSTSLPRRVMRMGMMSQMLLDNPWEETVLEEAEARVEFVEERRTARIDGLRLSADAGRRGEKLTAIVRLRPYRSGRIVEKRIPFRIPENAEVGSLVEVTACDGPTSAQLSRQKAPGKFWATNLDRAMNILKSLPAGDRLALRVSKPGAGLTVEGEDLPDLPGTTIRLLADPTRTGSVLLHDDAVTMVPMPWVIQGTARLRVRVKPDAEP